ncbi:hypothetical protein [uncultured Sphingomonas sp.]|uniref:hypothetical protein n=1 Tax=uncultured Sphingomonas sp. TaxID=158754 RepID=UPI0035CA6AE8
MSTIELADRMSRARATVFLFFAAVILLALWFSFGPSGTDFFQGLWFGITLASVLNLLPIKRWLRPGSLVARLMDDEAVREHRRMSCTAGFWAATTAAFAVALIAHDAPPVSAFDAARVVATAAVVAALVSFATLELRAGA